MVEKVYINLEILWEYLLFSHKLEKADAIIGFGSNDLGVAEKSVQLFKNGFSDKIIFSGGIGKGTKDWMKSEADCFKDIAIKSGVDKDVIYVENKSKNSGENIAFTKELIKQKGLNVKSAIIVHQPNMGRRIYATLKKQWPELKIMIADRDISLNKYLNDMHKNFVPEKEVINNIVGDFQRISKYAELGYQIPMGIPEDVNSAYIKLVNLGYDEYIIK